MKKIKIKNCFFITLPSYKEENKGIITVAEAEKHIPFRIKRVFYIYELNSSGNIRGRHAHKTLNQVIFCIKGSFLLKLDDGKNKISVKLNTPNKGIFIGSGTWLEMQDFSEDALLLVFASDYYNENEYIRDYEEFLNYVKNTNYTQPL